jgi:hypothetical protein
MQWIDRLDGMNRSTKRRGGAAETRSGISAECRRSNVLPCVPRQNHSTCFEVGLTLWRFPRTLTPSMSTRFFTNHSEQTSFKKFRGVFENNPDIERFDALVGYLRSSGYFALRPYLEKVPVKRAGDQSQVAALEAEIDAHVFRLYALTPEEIALVKSTAAK